MSKPCIGELVMTISVCRRITVLLAALIGSQEIASAQWTLFPATHSIGLSSQFYAPSLSGDRLVLVLEARSHPWRLPDQAATDTNVRGYLVLARLREGKDPDSTRQVVGPLYTIHGPVSSLVNDAGAPYSNADAEALLVKRSFSIRAPDVLVKSRVINDGRDVEDSTLNIGGKTAKWVTSGARARIRFLGWASPDFVESGSRRYVAQKEADGQVRIYYRTTAKEINDGWLKEVFTQYFSRDDLGNSDLYISDDLNYVALFFRLANRVTGRDGIERLIKTFDFNGQPVRRENRFIVFSRPNVSAKLYDGPGLHPFPVIWRGKLVMLKLADGRLALSDLEKKDVVVHDLSEPEKWIHESIWQDDPGEKQVTFMSGASLINGQERPDQRNLHVGIWDYERNHFSQFSLSVADLFELKSDGYYPKSAIPIEK
jgi:hypothetical protein